MEQRIDLQRPIVAHGHLHQAEETAPLSGLLEEYLVDEENIGGEFDNEEDDQEYEDDEDDSSYADDDILTPAPSPLGGIGFSGGGGLLTTTAATDENKIRSSGKNISFSKKEEDLNFNNAVEDDDAEEEDRLMEGLENRRNLSSAGSVARPGSGDLSPQLKKKRKRKNRRRFLHLTSDNCKKKILRLEKEIEEQRKRDQELADERELLEEKRIILSQAEANKSKTDFVDQSHFRWALPTKTTIPPKLENGCRVRPELSMQQPQPIPSEPSALLNFYDQEKQWGERYSGLQLRMNQMELRRKRTEFEMEESLFCVPSSDDSEGYDEDFQQEWREETNEIFSVCRRYETDITNEVAAMEFVELLKRYRHLSLTPTERSFIWDVIRLAYRLAEPVHQKHWLASVHEIVETGNFAKRPSVATYCHMMHTAVALRALTERQRQKVERWAARSAYIIRKRVLILQEFGIAQPTWADVNSSCANLSRNVQVPTMTLQDCFNTLTAHSAQQEVASPSRYIVSSNEEGEAPSDDPTLQIA